MAMTAQRGYAMYGDIDHSQAHDLQWSLKLLLTFKLTFAWDPCIPVSTDKALSCDRGPIHSAWISNQSYNLG